MERPPAQQQQQQQPVSKDCLTCRTVGVLTFGGVGVYMLHLFQTTPKRDKGQRLFVAAFAAAAFGLSAYRATN